ncbi:MAG: tetratricopeptide repeat protein, partial [Planctomycetes bacterium]|nr:tetratricopeptide repeat protein [Planctomycetota bacterium]
LGVMFAQQGDYNQALECFARALQTRNTDSPDNYRTYQNIAQALSFQKDIAGAIKNYRLSLKYKSDNPECLYGLSWLLATSDDDQLRNGSEALALAQKGCELTQYQRPENLGALAAAFAETGRFTEAIDTIQKAIDLFRSTGLNLHADNAERQLKQYQAQKPFRDK